MITSCFDEGPPPSLKSKDSIARMDETGQSVRVRRDYFGKSYAEMSVFTDDNHLELLDDSHPYWWLLKDSSSKQVGYVPASIVKTDDEVKAASNALQNMNLGFKSIDKLKSRNAKNTKRVSFSPEAPVQHVFERIEYEDEEGVFDMSMNEGSDDLEDDLEESDSLKGSTFLRNALIDEAVRKALGIISSPDADPESSAVHIETAQKAEDAFVFGSNDFISNEERIELPDLDQKSGFLSKFWPMKKNVQNAQDQKGMVKVFAGNFMPISTYKTCILEDSSTLLELEAVAKRLYHVDDKAEDYELTMVHSHSHHVLPVRESYSLGTLMEIAKISTVEDGHLRDEKGKYCSRHRKKLSRSHLSILRKRQQSISLKGIKAGFSMEIDLERHSSSDFPTNYRFILNLKIAPLIRGTFFIWIELETPNKEQQESSRIGLAVKALTNVDEIIKRSLVSMNLGNMEGVSYDLVFNLQPSYIHQYCFDPKDGREVLSREMTMNDVRNQWPHIDASGLKFLLRPYVTLASDSSSTFCSK